MVKGGTKFPLDPTGSQGSSGQNNPHTKVAYLGGGVGGSPELFTSFLSISGALICWKPDEGRLLPRLRDSKGLKHKHNFHMRINKSRA